MSSRRFRAAALAAAAVLLAGCAHDRLKLGASKDGEVVEAEGWSPVDPKDPLGTRQRALAEAQKKAVEQVVGVYISARTRVEAAITVDQKILANVGGYVQKYEAIKDWEEDGFHKTRIRALVLYKKVGEDLKELGLVRPKPPPGNPKVAVALQGKTPEARAAVSHAASALARAMVERGFLVLDSDDKADIRITGEADAYPLVDARLGDFRSYRARVSVQAVKAKTGEILTQQSQEASAIDPAAEIAAAKALENAGQLAGEALASELSGELKSQTGIVVAVRGLQSLGDVERLAEDLRSTPGIDGAVLSEYRDGTAELAVTAEDMTGEALAAELLRMRRFHFKALSVSPYRVELQAL